MESKIRCQFDDTESDSSVIVSQPHGQGIPHAAPGAGNAADMDQSMPNIVQAALSEVMVDFLRVFLTIFRSTHNCRETLGCYFC